MSNSRTSDDDATLIKRVAAAPRKVPPRLPARWAGETAWLANDGNFTTLTDLSGRWIDRVHSHRPPSGIDVFPHLGLRH